jgi:uncharacterized delta-60 repeat protein
MQQETTMYQWMISSARQLQAVGRHGGGVGVLAVMLFLPLTAVAQGPLKTLVPLESDAEVAARGPVAPGDLDTSFGGEGKVPTDFGDDRNEEARALAIQADGKLVVAGESIDSDNSDFALARYLPDGTLDSTFSDDGKVLTDFNSGSHEGALTLALQPDGKLVAAGDFTVSGINADFALARYRPNGTLDSAFGSAGKVTTEFRSGSMDAGIALAIQPRDGRLVVAGDFHAFDSNTDPSGPYRSGITRFALARYHAITCSGVVVTRVGTASNDTIVGTPGNDVIFGFAGHDRISGLGSDDILCGGTGNDTLQGGSGKDLLSGGPGTDRCHGGSPGSGDTASNCERVTGVP